LGTIRRTWLVLAVALVSACGGGGGGGGELQQPLFQVTAVTPYDASEDIGLTQEINLVFTHSVDATSLTSTSLEVVAESGDVIPGDRLVSPLTRTLVRFLPRTPYLPFAIHTIRVTTAVRDDTGMPLDREYTFEFRTEVNGPVIPGPGQLEDLGNLLVIGRFFHRMTLLKSGRFLVTGGYPSETAPALFSCENLIPPLRQSTVIARGMLQGRAGHAQLMLKDGRVLVAGGEAAADPFLPLESCEIFDPSPSVFGFTPAASMNFPRSFPSATLLPDGRVLVTGGQSLDADGNFIFRADAEIYDPEADVWTLVADRMERGRTTHFGARTPAGDVVLIGGTTGSPSATLFRTATETFSGQLGSPYYEHFYGAATLLNDGRPFVAGGLDTRGLTIWDPQFGFLGAVNQMASERTFATATSFADGRVVIVGGMDLSAFPPLIHDTMDLFFPIGSTGKFFPITTKLPLPTTHHAAALGPAGNLWITGGLSPTGEASYRRVVVLHPE